MIHNLPTAKSLPMGMNIDDVKKVILQNNLVGLANNTKWDELINSIRSKGEWRPSHRSKWVNGYISNWDIEWFYHLPFPFIGVLWLDISLKSNSESTQWIVELVKSIGFEYAINSDIIRIYGYGPKSQEAFD